MNGAPLFSMMVVATLSIGALHGQRLPDTWGVSFHGGQVVQHTQNLTYAQPAPGYQLELECAYSRITPSGKYRQAGWIAQAVDFGNPATVGRAYIFTPTWQIPLNRHRRISLSWLVGTGLGWATHPFDPVTNPTNNSVSAHINNSALLGLRMRYAVANQWYVQHGLSLTHLSNAAASIPNLGINMVTLSTGIRYKKMVDPRPLPLHTYPKRWQVMAFAGVASQEGFNDGGYKSLLYSTALQAGLRSGQGIWWLQTRYELPMSRYRLMVHFFDVPPGAQARQAVERWSMAVGREWLVGHFGLSCHVGSYIKAQEQPGIIPVYQIFAGNYYPRPINNRWQPFIGAQMKTHLSVAEYFLLVGGVRFSCL
jgi:hypothetical protein